MSVPHGRELDLTLVESLTALNELASLAEMPPILAGLLQGYGLKTLAYLGTGINSQHASPFLAVTYSPEWVEHYKTERFVEIDPAVQVGLRRVLPIDWSEFDLSDPKVRRLFGEAAEFGLGRQGISLPVHGRHGDRALISITSDLGARDWGRRRLEYMRDFQLLGLHIHNTVLRLEGNHSLERELLSPRERECLQWIAEGKTCWECAMILGLSERTVRCYLESARHKLGAANNTHAVNKARKADVLSDFP